MRTVANFILRFGKHKGREFKHTPLSYQRWLMGQDWFDITKQRTIRLRFRTMDGNHTELDTFDIPELQQIERCEVDPETKYYNNITTYLERDSDNGADH